MDVDEYDLENEDAKIPQNLKRLRACLRCHLVLNEKQVRLQSTDSLNNRVLSLPEAVTTAHF